MFGPFSGFIRPEHALAAGVNRPITSFGESEAIRSLDRDVKPDLADIILPLCIGVLTAEVALPWLLVCLSNYLIFDIPDWSLWLVFAGPPGAALVVLFRHCALPRARACHPPSPGGF